MIKEGEGRYKRPEKGKEGGSNLPANSLEIPDRAVVGHFERSASPAQLRSPDTSIH